MEMAHQIHFCSLSNNRQLLVDKMARIVTIENNTCLIEEGLGIPSPSPIKRLFFEASVLPAQKRCSLISNYLALPLPAAGPFAFKRPLPATA